MNVQATSIDAFNANGAKFVTMNDRIMLYMRSHVETRTRAEIADALGISTSTMSGRIRDLLDQAKLIEEPGRFTCKITGTACVVSRPRSRSRLLALTDKLGLGLALNLEGRAIKPQVLLPENARPSGRWLIWRAPREARLTPRSLP